MQSAFCFYGWSGLGPPPVPCGLCDLYGGFAPMPLKVQTSIKYGQTSILLALFIYISYLCNVLG